MRRCVASLTGCSSGLLPAHSGSTRRYVRGAVHASMRASRGAVRALSSTTRSAALQRLGCTEASSREAIRDAYYKRAKACHPDQGGTAAEFRALATAYERALRGGDDDDTADTTPEHGFAADDPLASQLNDVGDVERVLPGYISVMREWLRMYKTVDGKPMNQFGLEEKAMGREYTMAVVQETHEFWRKLTSSGQKTV